MKGELPRFLRRHADRDAGVPFTPLAGARLPFKAARAVAEALEAAHAITEPEHKALALDAIEPPRSRGHGGKRNPFQRSVLGRAMRDRSKYVPKVEDRKHARERIFGRMSAALIEGRPL